MRIQRSRCLKGVSLGIASIAALAITGSASARLAHDAFSAKRLTAVVPSTATSSTATQSSWDPLTDLSWVKLKTQYSAVSTQPLAGTMFTAVRGSWAGSWDGMRIGVEGGKNYFCTASVSPSGGGSPLSLGWGDMGPWWQWPDSNEANWSWQIPSGTAGDTLSVECAPFLIGSITVIQHWVDYDPVTHARVDHDVTLPRGESVWVCSTWMSGPCLHEPDFRSSWTIAKS